MGRKKSKEPLNSSIIETVPQNKILQLPLFTPQDSSVCDTNYSLIEEDHIDTSIFSLNRHKRVYRHSWLQLEGVK